MYAKSTDTGIDPKEAAKRLNVEWDSAAAIEEVDVDDEQGVVTKVAVCSHITLKHFHSFYLEIVILSQHFKRSVFDFLKSD